MSASFIYPWQQAAWDRIIHAFDRQQLPHAILLAAPQGYGKLHFAEYLAQFLMCENRKEKNKACLQCPGCQLWLAGSHFDFQKIEPEESGKTIKVDQIREINHFLQQSTLRSQYKVVIYHPAEAFNLASSNALLKTLEEPTASKSLQILISHRPHLILPTLRSRCQQIYFDIRATETIMAWLNQNTEDSTTLALNYFLAQGAPLTTLDYAKSHGEEPFVAFQTDLLSLTQNQLDPIVMADRWDKVELEKVLHWMMLLIYLCFTDNHAFSLAWVEQGKKIAKPKLLAFEVRLQQQFQSILQNPNLNRNLLLVTLFIEWSRLHASC